jgi:hypothetical protein
LVVFGVIHVRKTDVPDARLVTGRIAPSCTGDENPVGTTIRDERGGLCLAVANHAVCQDCERPFATPNNRSPSTPLYWAWDGNESWIPPAEADSNTQHIQEQKMPLSGAPAVDDRRYVKTLS